MIFRAVLPLVCTVSVRQCYLRGRVECLSDKPAAAKQTATSLSDCVSALLYSQNDIILTSCATIQRHIDEARDVNMMPF